MAEPIRNRLPRIVRAEVQCPAGQPIAEQSAGSGCHCTVTDSDILAMTDPSSLGFCLGAYRACPVWQAEKERLWAAQRKALIEA